MMSGVTENAGGSGQKNMKIHMMKEFVRLAELKNYSKAAKELYIAQPVLSRHIASMEEELHVKLIERSRSSFELTKAGETALSEMKKIIAAYDRMIGKLEVLERQLDGELKIGALYYDMDSYVSKVRSLIRSRFPNIHLVLKSYQPTELETDLLEGKLDIALIYGVQDCTRKDISSLPLLKIPYLLIFDAKHRFADMKDIRISDLDQEAILIPEQAFAINSVAVPLFQIMEENNVHFSSFVPVGNYDEVPWILKDTGAVYISPMANPAPYGNRTEYREIVSAENGCDVSAVWLKTNDNPVLQTVLQALRSEFTYAKNA